MPYQAKEGDVAHSEAMSRCPLPVTSVKQWTVLMFGQDHPATALDLQVGRRESILSSFVPNTLSFVSASDFYCLFRLALATNLNRSQNAVSLVKRPICEGERELLDSRVGYGSLSVIARRFH